MIHRNLTQWLTYLEQLHPNTIDMGLERLEKVANRLQLTRPAPLVITVTGTNGKGSTCAFIASLIQQQGLNVGVYSSPHLLHYEERISINNTPVTEAMLCEAFAKIESARGEISLTYFEFGTLAAFLLFEQANLDAVILEVGLGGRLDAVNLIDADIAVVTSIGIDHQEWLGSTRESVAFEKAGIFRANHPAVCGDTNPPLTLIEQAQEKQAPLFVRNKDFSIQKFVSHWQWQGTTKSGKTIELNNIPLLDLPIDNAAVALQVFALLDLPWHFESINNALINTKLLGRLQKQSIYFNGKQIDLLLDVGHNPHAAIFLANYLKNDTVKKRYAVFGLLADKDLEGVITPLAPLIDDWAVAPLQCPRSNTGQTLADALEKHTDQVTITPSIDDALMTQLNKAQAHDEIVIFGSFYVVSEALYWLDHYHRK